ncbi:MAG: hypothetical protein ABSB01_18035 [Streptosporangiaceae bacterium]|jgi:hypothetical protein
MEPPAPPGAEAVVRIWERGRDEHPVGRALTILAGLTQRPRQELASMSVERRDRMLLAWRSRLFGDTLGGYAACPGCGCGVDVSLTAGDPEESGQPEERFLVEVAGTKVAVRLPTSLDLAAVACCESVEAARRTLVRRCVEDGQAEPGPDGDAVAAAAEAELDRRAGTSAGVMTLACPDCGREWDVELDVAAFAWREIEILAGRLLRYVDVLARRYGWSEHDILRMSPARRRFYLELAS